MHNFVLSVFVFGIIWARGDHNKFVLKKAIAYLGFKNRFYSKPNTKLRNFKRFFTGKKI